MNINFKKIPQKRMMIILQTDIESSEKDRNKISSTDPQSLLCHDEETGHTSIHKPSDPQGT